jgi:hypothetical protein
MKENGLQASRVRLERPGVVVVVGTLLHPVIVALCYYSNPDSFEVSGNTGYLFFGLDDVELVGYNHFDGWFNQTDLSGAPVAQLDRASVYGTEG